MKLLVLIVWMLIGHSECILNSIEYILEPLEQLIINSSLIDCTKSKQLLFEDYDSLMKTADLKFSTVSLKQYVGRKRYYYPFKNAYGKITTSQHFNKSLPTVIILYGYHGKFFQIQYQFIAKELNNLGKLNLFVLDDMAFVSGSYFATATYTEIVGNALGKLLAKLYQNGYGNFHLIGHSLGAHAAGFTGKTFKKLTGVNLRRISGLDPAGACFYVEPPEKRLTSTDADFVDVIHTQIGAYGNPNLLGHVDFFPNSGNHMPGCAFVSCSHQMSGVYYAESVPNNKFIAVQCSDWNTFLKGSCANNNKVPMGYWTPITARGVYYLQTNSKPPYAKDTSGVIAG